MKKKFDDSFKTMAVELSTFKGSVSEAAKEFDLTPSLLSRWRGDPRFNGGGVLPKNPKVSSEEQEIRILRKKLRDSELECEILKKAVAIFSKTDRINTNS